MTFSISQNETANFDLVKNLSPSKTRSPSPLPRRAPVMPSSPLRERNVSQSRPTSSWKSRFRGKEAASRPSGQVPGHMSLQQRQPMPPATKSHSRVDDPSIRSALPRGRTWTACRSPEERQRDSVVEQERAMPHQTSITLQESFDRSSKNNQGSSDGTEKATLAASFSRSTASGLSREHRTLLPRSRTLNRIDRPGSATVGERYDPTMASPHKGAGPMGGAEIRQDERTPDRSAGGYVIQKDTRRQSLSRGRTVISLESSTPMRMRPQTRARPRTWPLAKGPSVPRADSLDVTEAEGQGTTNAHTDVRALHDRRVPDSASATTSPSSHRLRSARSTLLNTAQNVGNTRRASSRRSSLDDAEELLASSMQRLQAQRQEPRMPPRRMTTFRGANLLALRRGKDVVEAIADTTAHPAVPQHEARIGTGSFSRKWTPRTGSPKGYSTPSLAYLY